MAQIILFGGGDGGGIIITAEGVRPIPPFDPGLRLQLRGLSGLINGFRRVSAKPGNEMLTLINRISNLIIEQVEAVVGPLNGNNALIYQDDDGGFSCGSTGKPPIPFPWPAREFPSFNDLVTTGVLKHELLDFVAAVSQHGVNLLEALENPVAFSKKLDIKLSERSADDLRSLAPSQIKNITDPIDREVVEFFQKVAQDGRFIATWATKPAEAANALQVKLSDAAHDKIIAGSASTIYDPGIAMNPIAVAVAVGIVIMLVDKNSFRQEIQDFSGTTKF